MSLRKRHAKIHGSGDHDTTVEVTGHHTKHESSGSDEISVAGLKGALNDAQTPATHGSSVHNSTVLAAALLGAQSDQFLKIETKVIVGPVAAGDVPYGLTFTQAFPVNCNVVTVMVGDQNTWPLPAGYQIVGMSITALSKTGFTLTVRYLAAPSSPANIYFTLLAIGH